MVVRRRTRPEAEGNRMRCKVGCFLNVSFLNGSSDSSGRWLGEQCNPTSPDSPYKA